MAALLWHLIEVMHMVRDDLTGQRFGKLVVLKELGGGRILCRCDCGREKGFNKSNVKRGLAKSCGSCLRRHTRRDLIKDLKLRTPETLMRQVFIRFSDIRHHYIMHTVSGTFPIDPAVLPRTDRAAG